MSRVRRDPRAERDAAIVATVPRLRIDRTHRGGPGETAAAQKTSTDMPPITIADPAFLVFAVVEAPGGALSRHDRQVIGAARSLDGGGKGAVVVLGPTISAEAAGAAGADRLIALSGDGYDPEARSAAVAAAVSELAPLYVVFPETADGGDLARRVAAQLDEVLFDSVESLSARMAIRPAEAELVEWRSAPARLMTIAADRVPPYQGRPHANWTVEVPAVPSVGKGIVAAEWLKVDAAEIPLGEAGFVVSAGNGVTDFAVFRSVAKALRATPGGSRVVCDAGRLPRAMQVGASGTVLNADCYFALGISGAPQHLQGIGSVEHVVAVNTDLHAAMIARADLAIIADAQKVMPALLDLLGERA